MLNNVSSIGSDYNMELIIALEMSRLQMIEDQMKQAQVNAITPDLSSSISNNSTESGDDQLKLAIQLSLQESTAAISKQMQLQREDGSISQSYQKTSADLTVDYFLKSLANHKIDLKHLEVDVNKLSASETDREVFFRPCNGNEDGRFQISDIHDKGFAFEDVDDYDDADVGLKRSHSTGDLCVRRSGRGTRIRMRGDEPRYHLDSDHSSQHDDKPEDLARRILALPSTSVRTKQFLLLHHAHPEEESYQEQSSVEDTTTSDSFNADMEVCGILSSLTDEDIGRKAASVVYNDEEVNDEIKKTDNNIVRVAECKKQTHNPFASLKAKLCSAHLPKTSYLTRIAVNKSIGLLSDHNKVKKNCDISIHNNNSQSENDVIDSSSIGINESFQNGECKSEKHSPKFISKYSSTCCKQSSFSKSTGFLLEDQKKSCKGISSNLRIKICKNSDAKCGSKNHTLETDSSNEYESETGIPKSPTLFISGVSICRTPEPKSPGLILLSGGRQSRSSSLSVPVPLTSCSLNISSTSLTNTITITKAGAVVSSNNNIIISNGSGGNNLPPEPFTPSLVRSSTPAAPPSNRASAGSSPSRTSKDGASSAGGNKSKSASEPEREREMFRFPKSSTDGALSSVLHIQESNLSSDDFHEALFLLERSPKTRDSKRRKKTKKKDEKKEDASSIL